MRTAALILAAGSSRRAGRQNKLLYQYRQRPLLAWVADAVSASSVHYCIGVSGYQREQIESLLAGYGIACVYNSDYAGGMAGSLTSGVSALLDYDAIIVCLGDMPHISAGHIDAVVHSAKAYPGKNLLVPHCAGHRGHPVLIRRALYPQLLTLKGDVGARVLFDKFAGQVQEVAIDSDAILQDYDTAESLATLQHGHASDQEGQR